MWINILSWKNFLFMNECCLWMNNIIFYIILYFYWVGTTFQMKMQDSDAFYECVTQPTDQPTNQSMDQQTQSIIEMRGRIKLSCLYAFFYFAACLVHMHSSILPHVTIETETYPSHNLRFKSLQSIGHQPLSGPCPSHQNIPTFTNFRAMSIWCFNNFFFMSEK